ncbi:MAG: CBS domain-containing protein [Chloroflexi bacterium]|nr:MAG: CBS domain-containing protein [Chloroflexota bacterium]TMC73403.1 MAG: CBS domain-containing protein [Chloroflexota bacterium]
MSPRAAWRLESLGFADVYEYVDGKLDWMAAGLPTEGTNAQQPRAGDIARKDVPTCGLKDRVGDARERAKAQGWDAVVVVNDERVVLGMLRSKELAADADEAVETAMRSGPGTFRPFVSLHEMAHFMIEHKVESAPISTSDGRLVGLLLQKDVLDSMKRKKK